MIPEVSEVPSFLGQTSLLLLPSNFFILIEEMARLLVITKLSCNREQYLLLTLQYLAKKLDTTLRNTDKIQLLMRASSFSKGGIGS